ncbi:hypothetical protein D5085_18360 [Ectothiorhodospiraceae bacterium BW-2]|nr:hypothetical protein D5085_18360 [Ectothiorhodospiraceae bacterium BW-2]
MIEFREQLQREGVIFCYCGFISEDLLASIGNQLRGKLEQDEVDKKVARTVFHLFVEQVQNVIRYSVEPTEKTALMLDSRYGLAMIGELEGEYFVTCSNMIRSDEAPKLSGNLEHILSLSGAELKQLYREALRGETPEGSKGAGVGFIDIARRAKSFIYDIEPIDSDYSYLSLKAFV